MAQPARPAVARATSAASKAPAPHSLVQRLSRSLTAAVVGMWVLSTMLVAAYVDDQIQHNFDLELQESAHRQLYPTWLAWHSAAVGTVPAGAAVAPATQLQGAVVPEVVAQRAGALLAPQDAPPLILSEGPGDWSSEPLLLQLRAAQGAVLLHSRAAPAAPFAVPLQAGFFDTETFRVFSLFDAERQVWLQLADPLAERQAASQRTWGGLLVVLLVMLPLLVWLIRHIAQRELRSVVQLQADMQARSGHNLQPLVVQGLPAELQAVGVGINGLLERLGEALNVERALAANAAHELRTPLAQVRLRLQAAVDQAQQRVVVPTADQPQWLDFSAASSPAVVPLAEVQSALASLEVLSHRTERLLQLSRAEGGDAAQFAPVNVVQLCEQVAQEFWQQPRARKKLDWLGVETGEAVWVLGDIDSLAIVLRNLIDNALHHTQGAVVLALEADAQVRLWVRDAGPGLTPAQIAQLAQRHVRSGSAHMGYGLGLSIVRSIADKHQGTLHWQSPPSGQEKGLAVCLQLTRWVPTGASQ